MKLPQPSPWSPGGGATQKCSENVGKMFGTGGAPSPASPLGCVSSKMFGKCSELVGAPVPWVVAPSPPLTANLRKCWEMFGKCSENVRNWCGRPKVGGWWSGRPNSEHFPNIFQTFPKICGSRLPPRGRGTHQLQTFSTNFRMAHSPGGRLGERPGQFQTFPNISEPFRTFSGGATTQRGEAPNNSEHVPNIFRTFLQESAPRGVGGRGDGKAPAPYSTPPRRHLQYVSPTRTPTGGSDRPPKQKSAPLWPGGLSTGISNAVSSSTQSMIRNRHHDSRTRGSGAPGKHLQV